MYSYICCAHARTASVFFWFRFCRGLQFVKICYPVLRELKEQFASFSVKCMFKTCLKENMCRQSFRPNIPQKTQSIDTFGSLVSQVSLQFLVVGSPLKITCQPGTSLSSTNPRASSGSLPWLWMVVSGAYSGFHKWGYPKSGMVYFMENSWKFLKKWDDDLGVALFPGNLHILDYTWDT